MPRVEGRWRAPPCMQFDLNIHRQPPVFASSNVLFLFHSRRCPSETVEASRMWSKRGHGKVRNRRMSTFLINCSQS